MEAISAQVDPAFALAWSHLALSYSLLYFNGVPLPAIAYLLIVASSVAALTRWPHASLTVGVATAILLSVGIRNAWDMALFVAGSSSDEKDATHRGSGQ